MVTNGITLLVFFLQFSQFSIKDAARASTFALKSVTANNSKPISGENFEAKNKRLKRPISPHLSIYNFETTMAFSITHRFTGLALNGMLYGIAAGKVTFINLSNSSAF